METEPETDSQERIAKQLDKKPGNLLSAGRLRMERVPFPKSEEHQVEPEDGRCERGIVHQRPLGETPSLEELIDLGHPFQRESEQNDRERMYVRNRVGKKKMDDAVTAGPRGDRDV